MAKANRWPTWGRRAAIGSKDGENGNGWCLRLRTAAAGAVWSTALAVALGLWLPVVAEAKIDGRDAVLTTASPVWADIDWASLLRGDQTIVDHRVAEVATLETSCPEVAEFELIALSLIHI